MPDTSEYRSGAGESSLSPVELKLAQILERQVDSRYALSAKAAAGILRRASRRGRRLPEPLERALILVAGGGAFNATGAFGAWIDEEYARELSRRDYKSSNHLTIGFGHTQGIDIQPGDTAPTLRVGGGGQRAYRKSARVSSPTSPETWVDDGKANTLNRFDVGDVRTTHAVVDTASTLQGSGASLRGQRIDAEGAAGGHLVPGDTVVRRLTPAECEALMGWPRNHIAPEGIKAPDSRRYAACGDGIVANVAFWIGQRIVQIDKETA